MITFIATLTILILIFFHEFYFGQPKFKVGDVLAPKMKEAWEKPDPTMVTKVISIGKYHYQLVYVNTFNHDVPLEYSEFGYVDSTRMRINK